MSATRAMLARLADAQAYFLRQYIPAKKSKYGHNDLTYLGEAIIFLKMWSLYKIIHIWTAVVDESEEWSSQLIFQFKQLERRSLKKSGLQRDSNPWPPRYRCDALPTELWSHTLGARSIYWVHIFPWGVKWCEVYMKLFLWLYEQKGLAQLSRVIEQLFRLY